MLLLECAIDDSSFDLVIGVPEAFTFFFDGSGMSCE